MMPTLSTRAQNADDDIVEGKHHCVANLWHAWRSLSADLIIYYALPLSRSAWLLWVLDAVVGAKRVCESGASGSVCLVKRR